MAAKLFDVRHQAMEALGTAELNRLCEGQTEASPDMQRELVPAIDFATDPENCLGCCVED